MFRLLLAFFVLIPQGRADYGTCGILVEKLRDDPRTSARIKKAEADREWIESYGIPPEEVEFLNSRRVLLPLLADPNAREAAREVARSELREDSEDLVRALRDPNTPQDALVFDDIVIGGGVHGLIASESARDQGRKVLVVEANDDIGSVFRAFGDGLLTNSRGRPEKYANPRENQISRPGQGNLNSIPGARVQTVDATGAQYPTGTDLADTLLFEFHGGRNRRDPAKNPDDPTANNKLNLILNRGLRSLQLREQLSPEETRNWPREATSRIILNDGTVAYGRGGTHFTVGNGSEGLPFGQITNQRVATARYDDVVLGRPQRLWFSGEFLKANHDSKGATVAGFKGKRVVVVGGGDQAKVVLENLVRDSFLFQKAGSSPSQLGGPIEITALGLDANTCKEFLDTVRARYSRLSGSIQRKEEGKPDDSVRRPINAVNALAVDFTINGQEFQIKTGPRKDAKEPPSIDSANGDIVIFATGPKPDRVNRPYLRGIIVNPNGDLIADNKTIPVVGTLLGYEQPVRLGNQLVDNSNRPLPIYFWGAGNKLAESGETEGIKENIDSIYALGRRTAAGIHLVSPKPEMPLPPVPSPTRRRLRKDAGAEASGGSPVLVIESPSPPPSRPNPNTLDFSRPILSAKTRGPEDVLVLEDVVIETKLHSILQKYFDPQGIDKMEMRFIRLDPARGRNEIPFALFVRPPLSEEDVVEIGRRIRSSPDLLYAIDTYIGGKARANELVVSFKIGKDGVEGTDFRANQIPPPSEDDLKGPGKLERLISRNERNERDKLAALLPSISGTGPALGSTVNRFLRSSDSILRAEGIRALRRISNPKERTQALEIALRDENMKNRSEAIRCLNFEEPNARLFKALVRANQKSPDPGVREQARRVLFAEYYPMLRKAENSITKRFARFVRETGVSAKEIPKAAIEFMKEVCNPLSAYSDGYTAFERVQFVVSGQFICGASLAFAGALADVVLTKGLQREPVFTVALLDKFIQYPIESSLISNSEASSCVGERREFEGTYAETCASAGGSGSPCVCPCEPSPIIINPWYQQCIRRYNRDN